jgi:hypothetical protein
MAALSLSLFPKIKILEKLEKSRQKSDQILMENQSRKINKKVKVFTQK